MLREIETKVNRDEFEVCLNGLMESKANTADIEHLEGKIRPLIDDLDDKVDRKDIEEAMGNAIRRKAGLEDIDLLNDKLSNEIRDIHYKL